MPQLGEPMSESTDTPRRAVIFGHSDGDGYLAAEVSRENLVAEGWAVSSVVSPHTTANYRFWENQFQEWDFSYLNLVVVVDVAFDFDDPARSCDALSRQAAQFPKTRFLVIDHHPLRAGEWLPHNVTLSEKNSVYTCCYGEPNDLMVIASICDKDEEPVRELISPAHRVIAEGVRRAAADTDGIAGEQMITMLENKQWAWFYTLGAEPKDFHRTYYGRRTKTSQASPALTDLKRQSP